MFLSLRRVISTMGLQAWNKLGICILLNTAQIVSGELFRLQANTPIQGFSLPMFNPQGQKIWQCLGDQVRYLSETKIKIEKMHIEYFSIEDETVVDMDIRSPKAVVSLTEHKAHGRDLLTITNPGYTVIGENWTWEGKHYNDVRAKIIIKKNAHVSFYESTNE